MHFFNIKVLRFAYVLEINVIIFSLVDFRLYCFAQIYKNVKSFLTFLRFFLRQILIFEFFRLYLNYGIPSLQNGNFRLEKST